MNLGEGKRLPNMTLDVSSKRFRPKPPKCIRFPLPDEKRSTLSLFPGIAACSAWGSIYNRAVSAPSFYPIPSQVNCLAAKNLSYRNMQRF